MPAQPGFSDLMSHGGLRDGREEEAFWGVSVPQGKARGGFEGLGPSIMDMLIF